MTADNQKIMDAMWDYAYKIAQDHTADMLINGYTILPNGEVHRLSDYYPTGGLLNG